jgi:hypothetical protein
MKIPTEEATMAVLACKKLQLERGIIKDYTTRFDWKTQMKLKLMAIEKKKRFLARGPQSYITLECKYLREFDAE